MLFEVALFIVVLLLLRYWISEKPKKFPPGPRGLPIVGYIPFLGREPHRTFSSLSKKYGDVIGTKLGTYEAVIINNIDLMRNLFKKDVFNGRPNFFLFTAVETGKNGIIRSDGHYWVEQRRYTLHRLRDFGFGKRTMEDLILSEVTGVVNYLRKSAGKPIDLDEIVSAAVVNTLWQMATGNRFELEDEKLKNFISILRRFLSEPLYQVTLGFLPWIGDLFPNWSGHNDLVHLEQSLNGILRETIQNHQLKNDYASDDFTDEYLSKIRGTKDEDSSFFGEKGQHSLLIVLQDFFIAGSETTISTLKWIFLYLVMYPNLQNKCKEEIDKAIGREITPKLYDKPRLPYCEAFITEVMRIRPTLPFAVIHTAMEDLDILNYKIPKGTLLLPNIWHAHNDPSLWDKPDQFRPERFIADDGRCQNTENVITFGVGKRSCLGEGMARAELFLFTTNLLHQYTISLPNEDSVPTLKPNNSSILLAPCPYRVVVTQR